MLGTDVGFSKTFSAQRSARTAPLAVIAWTGNRGGMRWRRVERATQTRPPVWLVCTEPTTRRPMPQRQAFVGLMNRDVTRGIGRWTTRAALSEEPRSGIGRRGCVGEEARAQGLGAATGAVGWRLHAPHPLRREPDGLGVWVRLINPP